MTDYYVSDSLHTNVRTGSPTDDEEAAIKEYLETSGVTKCKPQGSPGLPVYDDSGDWRKQKIQSYKRVVAARKRGAKKAAMLRRGTGK